MTRIHQVTQHRTDIAGVDAITLVSNHHFPRHAHDQLGIGLLSAGGHRSWSGIGQVEAYAGDVIMVNPGEMHDGAPVDGRPRTWRMLYFDPKLVAGELSEDDAGAGEIVHPVATDALLSRRVVRLFALATAGQADSLAVEQALLQCVVSAFQRHGGKRPVPQGQPACVTKAMRLIHAAPQLPVSLAELAKEVGVSRFQLLRGFSRALGITPHAYVVQQRIQMARRSLTRGDAPAYAALQAGFADQSHMTRVFVRQLGVTPARYQAAAIFCKTRDA